MNAEFVRDAVSRFGDDPEGMGRFRKVVIGLAIAGKLAGEGQRRSPAEMLDQIESEKIRLLRVDGISKPKRFPPVIDEQLPQGFADPSAFAPLGAVARIEKGLTGIQGAKSGSFPLVVTAAERGSCDHFDFDGAATIVPLVSSTGHGNASINRLHYQEGRFALGTILAAIFPYAPDLISARFIFEYLSTFKDELLVSRMTGTANVTLSIGRIAEVPIPLICPTVQRKADELMALCDRLEAARAERETARDTFTLSTLAKLNTPDPDTFGEDASFALANLAPLTTRPDQIKHLRQTILNLAVCGRLVESKASMRQGVLGQVGKFVGGSGFPKQFQGKQDLEIPFLKVSDMNLPGNGRLISTANNYVSRDDLRTMRAKAHPAGTIIFPKIGGAIATNKRRILGCPAAIDNNCAGQVPNDDVDVNWLYLVLSSVDMAAYQAGTAVPALNMKKLAEHPVLIPPKAEQCRIVAKVDELMALCDQIETSITTGEQTRSRLLEAVLHNALEPA